jgi:hypothetical protein
MSQPTSNRTRTVPSANLGMEWALVLAPAVAIAIDPWGHACVECIAGTHVPLEKATTRQLDLMRQGLLENLTGLVWVERPIETGR